LENTDSGDEGGAFPNSSRRIPEGKIDMRKAVGLFWLIAVLGVHSAFAETVPIAVIPLEANGVSQDEARTLTDRLQSILVACGKFEVLERKRVDALLREQSLELSGAVNQDDFMAKAGKLLEVRKMIGGSVGKVGETFALSLRMVDVATGKVERTLDREHRGKAEGLLAVIGEMGNALAGIGNEFSKGVFPDMTFDKVRVINVFTFPSPQRNLTVHALAWSPDDSLIILFNIKENRGYLFDVSQETWTKTDALPGWCDTTKFKRTSPNGEVFVSGTDPLTLSDKEMKRTRVLNNEKGGLIKGVAAAWSHSGRYLASMKAGNEIELIELYLK
jgi:Curli production assembly/transport component CsgG